MYMKINSFLYFLFEKITFFVIILSILSCSMNTRINEKKEKISKVEFKINKKNGVTLIDD